MVAQRKGWPSVGLLLLGAKGSLGTKNYHQDGHVKVEETTIVSTVFATTTIPVTCYENVTVPHYVDTTITNTNYVNTTLVNTVYKVVSVTESTTATLHYTTAVTETETDSTSTTNTLYFTESTTETTSTSTTDTLYFTVSTTDTESTSTTDTLYFTESTTETDSTTITNTETDTVTTTSTVPATITTYTTETIFSTTYDPCPKSCSISAATVNLYFWPTDRPYTYPSTYVDKKLGYTFVSPSVYMMIPTAAGINTAGQRAGPSTESWILPLDLWEVSTIDGSATKQLTLSHLRTDCPKSADASEIATMINSACDPILAAPTKVRSWAYPCNACGRFGLFDPPYAVPPVTGLVPTTTIIPVVTTTAAPVTPTPTVPAVVGFVEVVYYVNGQAVSTATLTSTGITGTVTSSVFISSSDAPSLPTATSTVDTEPEQSTISTEPEPSVTSGPSSIPPSFSEPAVPTSSPVTAAATILSTQLSLLTFGVMAALFLL
ncbi:hypothetical protein V8F06_011276 [Rhypophila decipiens]